MTSTARADQARRLVEQYRQTTELGLSDDEAICDLIVDLLALADQTGADTGYDGLHTLNRVMLHYNIERNELEQRHARTLPAAHVLAFETTTFQLGLVRDNLARLLADVPDGPHNELITVLCDELGEIADCIGAAVAP